MIAMSKYYRCLPSVLMNIEDEYTAFCFNEACCVIAMRLQEGDKPHYIDPVKTKEVKHYNSFKDMYKDILGG